MNFLPHLSVFRMTELSKTEIWKRLRALRLTSLSLKKVQAFHSPTWLREASLKAGTPPGKVKP